MGNKIVPYSLQTSMALFMSSWAAKSHSSLIAIETDIRLVNVAMLDLTFSLWAARMRRRISTGRSLMVTVSVAIGGWFGL